MKTIITMSFIVFAAFSQISYPQVYNWFPLNSGTANNLNCVNYNLIAGDNGTLLITSNYGNSWNPVSLSTTNDLKSTATNGTNIYIVVGESNTIFRSTNSGLNWSTIIIGPSNGLNSVSRTGNYYYAAGNSGTVVLSSNGGANWSTLTTSLGVDLYSISAFGFYAWAAGNSGKIFYTTNFGTNWVQQNTGVTVNLNSIAFTNALTGWAVGNNGTILHTSNGGTNWIQITSGTNSNLRSIYPAKWIAGDSGTILRGTNSGVNWILQNTGFTTDLNSIFYQSDENALTVGKGGKIYRRLYDSLYTPWKTFVPNNIGTYIINRGIFNQDIRYTNTPGFQWPMGSGKFAIFTTGLTIAAKYNGVLRMAAASYHGEYTPGYIIDSSGISVAHTDNRFRIYKVKRGDNANTNIDWAQWGNMVPYGAPYVDVNYNNTYDPAIDTPGYKGASQTIFACLTDGFSSSHTLGEGFGGGTPPLYAELHWTVWGFDKPGLDNVHFLKWDVINKSKVQWTSVYFSIVADPDLGNADDDFIGCDTTRNLGYCYNGDNDDQQGTNTYNYGLNPPAVGFRFLNCAPNFASLSSFNFFYCTSCGPPPCETDPNGEPNGAYNFMKGLKKDATPYVIPNTNPPQITKYNFSGDPELGTGWDESDGRVGNCNGSLYGPLIPGNPHDRRLLMNYGSEGKTLNPGDTQKILIAQMIARGTSNLNSVTLLKQLADNVKNMCDSGIIFGVKEISSNFPGQYKLYQNYPNPFNPTTNIKFDISPLLRGVEQVKLVIYDVRGREVERLVDKEMRTGSYSADWNASNFASGIYFYSLIVDNKTIDTKKLVLLK